MRFATLILSSFIFSSAAFAQLGNTLIFESDTFEYQLHINGKEYYVFGAKTAKIRQVEPGEKLMVFVKHETSQSSYRGELNPKEEGFWKYNLTISNDSIQIEEEQITEEVANDLGFNYVVLKMGNVYPLQRVNKKSAASSSMSMTRSKEEKPSSISIKDGKRVEETGRNIKTTGKSGSSLVDHETRTTRMKGDERETTILKPRKSACQGPWNDEERMKGLATVAEEVDDSGKLYVAKTLGIANCMLANDALELVNSLELEAAKIELAKFLYPSIVNKDQFEILEAAFESDASWDSVNMYIDIKYN